MTRGSGGYLARMVRRATPTIARLWGWGLALAWLSPLAAAQVDTVDPSSPGVTPLTPPVTAPAWGPQQRRILLVPLDDRPAATQFAEMIGQIGGVDVETPPSRFLGRFTTPGQPDAILGWMRAQDLSRFDAVVVSTDMAAYGGLVASRTDATPYRAAIERLRALQRLRRDHPTIPFYAYSAIMRLTPTAQISSSSWRLTLAQYVQARAKAAAGNRASREALPGLARRLPKGAIQRYDAARYRNHRVQQELVRMTRVRVFDYLILGQDDAQPAGPHIAETRRLREMARNLDVTSRVYFCEGIDQHANVLLSRALLKEVGWQPAVRIVYADDLGRQKRDPYEVEPVEASLQDQLIASGAREARPGEIYDYTLFVNTPEPRPAAFEQFAQALAAEVDQGLPVAVADVNLGKTGTGDPGLFQILNQEDRPVRLLAYAGWNTAGNTIGTAIPTANVVLWARRTAVDPLTRELNQRTFLLHRLINDFEFHRFTRPAAYRLVAEHYHTANRDETKQPAFGAVNQFVREDVERRLSDLFRRQFQGRRFFAGNRQYVLTGLKDVSVELPWPRAYEVRIGFRLQAAEVGSPTATWVLPLENR